MGPTAYYDVTPYVVMRGSAKVEILARCMCWDDAVIIAERHPGSYVHSTENGTDYYRNEHTVVAYDPKEVA